MRLLFDQNLSRNLVGLVRDAFPESQHVTALDLATATDREIWDQAREHGYLIVSKDSDFRQFAFLYGPPPKVLGFAWATPLPQRPSRSSSTMSWPSRRSRLARTRPFSSYRRSRPEVCVPRSASLARLCDVADALKVAITGRAELTGTSALSTPVAVDPLRGVEFWHEYPAGYTEGQLHDLSEDGIEILEPFERE